MSVTWVKCDPDEAQQTVERLNEQYAFEPATDHLIAGLQAEARSQGYRLVNPRFEWVETGGEPPYDDKAMHLLVDGVERMSYDGEFE